MNVNEFMAKHDITDADLERMATPFENGGFELEPDGKVFIGSHLDTVGTRRATVVNDEKELQSSQSVCRLSITDFPPRETGLIWSTWSFTPSSRLRPHLTHLKPSRRSTS